jgi:hypothetical protein
MTDLTTTLGLVVEPMLHDAPEIAVVRHRAHHRRRTRRALSAAVVGVVLVLLVTAGVLLAREGGSTGARIQPAHSGVSRSEATPPPSDPNAVATPADQRVDVVDHQGVARGWVIHDALYGADLSKPVTVAVYNDAGNVIGYYDNFTGFLEIADALAPNFDPIQFALRGRDAPSTVSHMTSDDYADCLLRLHDDLNFWAAASTRNCALLFRLVGGPSSPP